MINYTTELEPDFTYHIYNRAVGREKLFFNHENYLFFLKRYQLYISPIADTFCYCLMPNHFHLLVRFKSERELRILNRDAIKTSDFLSLQFSNFFNSYSKAFNKQEHRKGVLFMRPFKRKKIESLEYLRKVVHYIHYNPVEAELCNKPAEWEYSSFKAMLSVSKTMLMRDEVIALFNDIENFKYVHGSIPGALNLTGSFE